MCRPRRVRTALFAGMILIPGCGSEPGERVTADAAGPIDDLFLKSAGHRLGPGDAKVTIVTFVDFECPYCQELALEIKALRERYPESMAIVFRHFPLSQHANAWTAARASECAADQGAFWEYHDALFAGQELIGVRDWDDFAKDADLNLDFELFKQCVAKQDAIPSLSRDTLAAHKLGVTGTPTALVNNKLVAGPAAIRNEILEALNAR